MPTLTRWFISNDKLILSYIHDDDVAIVDVGYEFATHDAP
jgi:hypothetical protein